MATPSLSRIKQRDYRPQLLALARYYAREEAKAPIRAAGRKIANYLPKDITVMASAILLAEPSRSLPKQERQSLGGSRLNSQSGTFS